jgi:hypothetical protein
MSSTTKTVLKWLAIIVGSILVLYFGATTINGLLIKMGLKKDPNSADEQAKAAQALMDSQNQILSGLGNTSAGLPGASISRSKAQSIADEFYPLLNVEDLFGRPTISNTDLDYIYQTLKDLPAQPDRVLVVGMFGVRDFSLYGGTFGQNLQSFQQRMVSVLDAGRKSDFNALFYGTNISF